MIPDRAKAVVFDAVGTVIVPAVSAPVVYSETAFCFGVTVEPAEVLERFIAAYRVEEAIDENAGWVTDEDREVRRWQAIVAASIPGAPAGVFELLFDYFADPHAWKVPADATVTFAALETRGLRLGLGSNCDVRLELVVSCRPELAALADNVIISSRVGVRKPGRAFFDRVCAEMDCKPGEVVFVGDDYENDYLGASAAGMTAVLLDPKGQRLDVTPRITSLSELA